MAISETRQGKEFALISKLEDCPGWTDWMVPRMQERQEKIKTELLSSELTENQTLLLRNEYQVIKSWLGEPVRAKGAIQKAVEAIGQT